MIFRFSDDGDSMYAQLVDTGAKAVKTLDEMEPQERAFQERIDAGIKIEPRTGCPRPTARP
jgi:ring-1,2-phenylacetyl-CoA epoxidase subunit PaaA